MYLLLGDLFNYSFFYCTWCSLLVTLFSKIRLSSFEQKNDFKLGEGNEN